MRNLTFLLLTTFVFACGETLDNPGHGPSQSSLGCSSAAPPSSYVLDAHCETGVANPTRLLVTTTDFSTGAVSVAEVDSPAVDPDVALGSTDAIPFYHDGAVYLVHRYGLDYIDVLDAGDFTLRSQHPVTVANVSTTNPQSVAFRDDGLAFVPLFGTAEVQLFDFSATGGSGLVDSIGMGAYADIDGNPELSLSIACGSTIWVSAQRLDPNFIPAGTDLLIPIDAATCQTMAGEISLQGTFARQARLDPADANGNTLLILSDALERVDLATGTSAYAVAPALFTAAGLAGYQLQAFALHDSHTVYFAAYTADFMQVQVWRAPLNGATQLDLVLSGFNSVDETLEVIGDKLWFGDTTFGGSGLRVFDLTTTPPSELVGPLSTGLAPYSMIGLP